MKKREFLKLLGLGALGATGIPQSLDAHFFSKKAKKLPQRWMWMGVSPETTDDIFRVRFGKMAEAGIEAVLPQIYGSNMALFELPGFTQDRLLERILPLAHEAGLQVHAWMWTMPCNHPDILQKHPDWYAVNRLGESAHEKPAYVGYYKFLSPCHPEVQAFIAQRVEALGKIAELDGIHLDYIRYPDVILAKGLQPKYKIVQDKEYPQYDYGYEKCSVEAFKAKTGIDPLSLEDPSQNEAWRQHRYDSVTNLVNQHLVPIARKYGKTITAAVFPNWESVRQQWHRWDLDGFLPMLYNGFYEAPISWIGEQTEAALSRLKGEDNKKPVFSGLYLPDLPNEESLQQAVRSARSAGASGFAIFEANGMKPTHWDALKML